MSSTLGVAAAAALVDTPRGTLSAWRHRRLVPAGPFDLPKTLNLALFSRLLAAGLEPRHASTLCLTVQHRWPAIVAGQGERLYLVGIRNRDGGSWCTAFAGERDVPSMLADGALIISLTELAGGVLERLGHPRTRPT